MARKVDTIEQEAYKGVEQRLSALFNRFYRIQILQGLILSVTISALLFLGLIVVNETIQSDPRFRESILFIVLGACIVVFASFVIWPLVRWIKADRLEKLVFAESMLREKFPSIKDSLYNLIELGQMELSDKMSSLVIASIEERSKRISVFKFNLAVPLRKLAKPLVIGLVVISIYLGLSVILPDFIKSGYSKTILYKSEVVEKQSLGLFLSNDSLSIGLGENFIIRARAENNSDFLSMYIHIGASLFPMTLNKDEFIYELESVNGDVDFSLHLGEVESDLFRLEVIPIPEFGSITVSIIPPSYTKVAPTSNEDLGDLLIAEGSRVAWNLNFQNADSVSFAFAGDTITLPAESNSLAYEKDVYDSDNYRVTLISNNIDRRADNEYSIEVLKDQFPNIEVSQMADSIAANQIFFQANIEDDYGFHKMEFTILESYSGDTLKIDSVQIIKSTIYQRVYYANDFDDEAFSGKEVQYYFTIWDNDEVNGYKKVESRRFNRSIKTKEEKFRQNREKGEELSESVMDGKDAIQELNKKISELMKSQIIEDREEWEIKNQVEEISEMKNVLEEMIDNIKSENQKINTADMENSEQLSEILRKQEQIEDLFEQLMDEELEKLFEEFEKLAEEMSKKERIEKTEELKINLENLEEQLDVNLELLQKLEIEKEVLDIANQMEELSELLKQDSASTEMSEMKEKFDELDERYEEQLEKNKEFKKPDEMDNFKEEREEIQDEMDKAKEEKESKESKSDSESKDNAAKKMKELSKKMKEQVGSGGGKSLIDIDLLRQLARELNDYSFRQEDLLSAIGNRSSRTKIFQEVGVEQRQMELKFNVISDSLHSLGYQEPLIASLLNEEVFHVETSLKNLNRSVQEGLLSQVRYEQQKVMEGANELAVRLDEVLENMQSMSGEGDGKSKFTDSKPKDGSEKVGDVRKQQQSLKEQMKQMIQEMKNGIKEGGSGKQMVKMLSEREQLRKAMEQLKNSGQLGENAKRKIQEVQNMMEQVEKDIIYNQVSDITVQKEEWIQTRLLEAEQAEKEREKEDIRVSEEFRGIFDPNDLPSWKEFEKITKEQGRTMNYSDIKLKEYYRTKYSNYLKNLNKKKDGNKLP